jgi:hypothetical protein
VIVLIAVVIGDPYLMHQLGAEQPELPHSPGEWFERLVERSEELLLGAAEDVTVEPTPISETETIPVFGDAPLTDETTPTFTDAPFTDAPFTDAPNAAEEPDAETARRPFYYPTIESPVRR